MFGKRTSKKQQTTTSLRSGPKQHRNSKHYNLHHFADWVRQEEGQSDGDEYFRTDESQPQCPTQPSELQCSDG